MTYSPSPLFSRNDLKGHPFCAETLKSLAADPTSRMSTLPKNLIEGFLAQMVEISVFDKFERYKLSVKESITRMSLLENPTPTQLEITSLLKKIYAELIQIPTDVNSARRAALNYTKA